MASSYEPYRPQKKTIKEMPNGEKTEFYEHHYASGWLKEEIEQLGNEGWEYQCDLGGSNGLWSRPLSPKPKGHSYQRWEHRQTNAMNAYSESWGEDGWELCGFHNDMAWFKRPVRDESR